MAYLAGSLLVSAGLLRRDQLLVAQRLREQDGGTIGEALIRLGLLEEEQIVQFYHKRLMVPRLGPLHFSRVSNQAVAALPPDMVAEFRVFPVEIDAENTLTLAMADPSDTHAIDEIRFFVGGFIERAVAGESIIREAIERYYGVRFPSPPPIPPLPLRPAPGPRGAPPPPLARPPQPAATPLPAKPAPTPPLGSRPAAPPTEAPAASPIPIAVVEDEPVLLTRIKRSDSTPLPAAIARALPPPTSPAPPAAPSEPPAPAGPPAGTAEEPILLTRPLEARARRRTLPGIPVLAVDEVPLAALRAAASRDAVSAVLLDYVSTFAGRSVFFALRHGELSLLGGRGRELTPSLREALETRLAPSSLLHEVVATRLPYRGPLPATAENQRLTQALGVLGEVLALPIVVRGRIVAILLADELSSPLPEAGMQAAAREAGAAYERLILATKPGSYPDVR